MFIVALFTTAKILNKSRCPSTDEWIKMYLYTMEYYSARKKGDFAICCNTYGLGGHYAM